MHIVHLSTLFSLAIGASSIPTAARPQKPIYLPKRLIALEEHVVSPSLEAEVLASGLTQQYPGILDKMKDVGAGRLAIMNAGHVSMQVLAQQSASGLEDPAGCRAANDAVQAAIKANPTRFAGFAVLPMALPEEAAAELNRSVTDLGFKGAMIWNHLSDGTYYDASRFDPVFAMAQALDVPLYLHPAPPAAALASKLYAGNYAPDIAGRLGTIAWGWHIDVGTHVLRLYAAGLFDRFPHLKLILGHNGEGLPLFIDRVDATQLRKDASFNRIWNNNIWSTTSGLFTVRQFEQLRQVSPIERIMYSVDYPFGDGVEGWAFVGNLSKEGVLGEREMDLFAYKNAEELLGL